MFFKGVLPGKSLGWRQSQDSQHYVKMMQQLQRGVCKTRTGYLRMADADGKMRIEKCGWKKKMRIAEKVGRKKREMWMAKKQ